MSSRLHTSTFHLLLGLLATVPAGAQVPQVLGYQGRLLRSDGTAATGTATVAFGLFDAAESGSPLWTESQTLGLSDGYYSTFLGLVVPLAGALDGGPRWLEVRVGSETLVPRQQVGASSYALTAQNVSGGTANVTSLKVGGGTVIDAGGRLAGTARYAGGGGIVVDDASQTVSIGPCAAGQAMLHDGTTWRCGTVVTGVGAAGPLVATGTGVPQLSVLQAGSASNGYLSSTDWTAFNSRYGSTTQCAGDLSGTLSAPVVARLQSRAVSTNAPANAQVLKWNGSQWEPAADANSGGTLTGVTAVAPLTAQGGATSVEVSMAVAGGSTDGYLSSVDWSRFGAKYDAETQCGGDLAGTLGAPLVAKLQGVSLASTTPTASQVLRFDGSRWTPASLAIQDVGGLSSGYVDLSTGQSIAGQKTFAAAPLFASALDVGSGGTGATTAAANTFFAGPAGAAGAPGFRGLVTADLAGLGPGLTGLDAGALASGTVPDGRLSGSYGSALTFTNSGNSFTGNGAGLTSLSAGALASGTVPDGRLSGTYGSAVTFSNSANSFSGNGSGLTALSAGALASGTVPDGRLSGTYTSVLALSNAGNSFAGSFSGTHSGTFNGTLVAADSGNDVLGAIRFNGGHFQGFDGTRWLNLDNVPPPAIDSISPEWGPSTGATTVTIRGSNFQSLATVTVDGVSCTTTVDSTTSITCVTPANSSAGAKDVRVTNPDFQSITRSAGFSYHKPPAVTGVAPTALSTVGGVTVTIDGTDFVDTPAVLFGTTAATSVTFVSATRLRAVAPALGTGAATLRVTNPDTLTTTWTGLSTSVFIAATGGAVTYDSSGNTVHTFTSGTSTFTPSGSGNVEVLVVAGGGSGGGRGGNDGSGGGGAGGLIYRATFTVTGGTGLTVTVGAGGTGGQGQGVPGNPGQNSVFGSLTAMGGGRGGAEGSASDRPGGPGGSGGGAGGYASSYGGGAGTAGQGNNGGANPGNGPGGGGGGAGAVGGSTWGGPSNGGNGLQYSISGTATWYAGGGGDGGGYGYYGGAGGLGGGGAGGSPVSGQGNGVSGTANTGGGGGGANASLWTSPGVPGSGGSGVVIVRYAH